jgi:hypothetical protein
MFLEPIKQQITIPYNAATTTFNRDFVTLDMTKHDLIKKSSNCDQVKYVLLNGTDETVYADKRMVKFNKDDDSKIDVSIKFHKTEFILKASSGS